MTTSNTRAGAAHDNSPQSASPAEVHVIGLSGMGEVSSGADVAQLILDAAHASGVSPQNGDIVVVTHKVVSKAEGQVVELATVEPSAFALHLATKYGKDPRQVEVVLRESERIVRMDRGIFICQTRHGFICANAGVDASNVTGGEAVCLLPRDPDASAQAIRVALERATGTKLAVVITDSFGRPWRSGIINVAVGVAGMAPLADYRGQPDDHGRVMHVSILAVADEIASAAELVMGKVRRCPVAIVRGYAYEPAEGRASELVMRAESDLFR